MKRCSACGSISPDSEVTCGVCQSSIVNAPFESMEQIEADMMADHGREEIKEREEFEKVKVRLVVRTVVGLFVAAAAILAGLYLLGENNGYGFFLIVAGALILPAVLGTGPISKMGLDFGERTNR